MIFVHRMKINNRESNMLERSLFTFDLRSHFYLYYVIWGVGRPNNKEVQLPWLNFQINFFLFDEDSPRALPRSCVQPSIQCHPPLPNLPPTQCGWWKVLAGIQSRHLQCRHRACLWPWSHSWRKQTPQITHSLLVHEYNNIMQKLYSEPQRAWGGEFLYGIF